MANKFSMTITVANPANQDTVTKGGNNMTSAEKKIIEIISHKIAWINVCTKNHERIFPNTDRQDNINRLFCELKGMLICLKNITTTNRVYTVNDMGDYVEFGYYDTNSKWIIIEGGQTK